MSKTNKALLVSGLAATTLLLWCDNVNDKQEKKGGTYQITRDVRNSLLDITKKPTDNILYNQAPHKSADIIERDSMIRKLNPYITNEMISVEEVFTKYSDFFIKISKKFEIIPGSDFLSIGKDGEITEISGTFLTKDWTRQEWTVFFSKDLSKIYYAETPDIVRIQAKKIEKEKKDKEHISR